jgi:cytochrome bd-type quinol oxidase subunit 2
MFSGSPPFRFQFLFSVFRRSTLKGHSMPFDQSELQPTSVYSWPLRAISLLLFLQMMGLCIISAFFLQQVDWERELNDTMLSIAAVDVLVWTAVVAPLVVLLCITALGFFFRRSFAWHSAMTLQGVMLLGCLTIYFLTTSHLRNSHLLYLSMLYCILMVLYLNTSDVRMAFHVKQIKTDVDDDDEFTR